MYGIFSSFDETFIKYMRNHCQMKIFLFHHYPLENSYIKITCTKKLLYVSACRSWCDGDAMPIWKPVQHTHLLARGVGSWTVTPNPPALALYL